MPRVLNQTKFLLKSTFWFDDFVNCLKVIKKCSAVKPQIG
jgi:hypothetical protein